LAGANLREGREDDGILTAMEASGLNLWGTNLVVLYEAGKKFDIDDYCNEHIPMVQQKLGSACKRVAAEHGLAGG
jgi:hypothetical protein